MKKGWYGGGEADVRSLCGRKRGCKFYGGFRIKIPEGAAKVLVERLVVVGCS